jgi:hypothetical protein
MSCCKSELEGSQVTVSYGGRVQPVSATLYLFTKRWSVGNGLSDTDQVHGGPEG